MRKPDMTAYLRLLSVPAMMIAFAFGAAGRWDLPFFWAAVAIYALFMLGMMISMDPGLKRERLDPAPGGKDRFMRILMLPIIVVQWLIAGLDVGRFHWSDTVPAGLQMVALIGFVASLGLASWAMKTNRFFSPVVRVQQERGHHLITTGPYRFIRHPGYLGAMLAYLFASLALGSWWGMLPVAVYFYLFIRRALLEDRFLRAELPGYRDYAGKVHYGLLPGVW
jgi:protein-S-isoprenylcysteine O-methyltransferase Ste14